MPSELSYYFTYRAFLYRAPSVAWLPYISKYFERAHDVLNFRTTICAPWSLRRDPSHYLRFSSSEKKKNFYSTFSIMHYRKLILDWLLPASLCNSTQVPAEPLQCTASQTQDAHPAARVRQRRLDVTAARLSCQRPRIKTAKISFIKKKKKKKRDWGGGGINSYLLLPDSASPI